MLKLCRGVKTKACSARFVFGTGSDEYHCELALVEQQWFRTNANANWNSLSKLASKVPGQ
jgi:hypothetical protein